MDIYLIALAGTGMDKYLIALTGTDMGILVKGGLSSGFCPLF